MEFVHECKISLKDIKIELDAYIARGVDVDELYKGIVHFFAGFDLKEAIEKKESLVGYMRKSMEPTGGTSSC